MFEIITTKGELYDKCENMEELYDNFYYPLLVEHKELKKQLKPDYYTKGLEGTLKEYQQEMNNVVTQQKEFINWLENGIEKVKNTKFLDERIQRAGLIAYNRCLQKYRKIIGE